MVQAYRKRERLGQIDSVGAFTYATVPVNRDFENGFTEAQLIADGAQNVTHGTYGVTVSSNKLVRRNDSTDRYGSCYKDIGNTRNIIQMEFKYYGTYGSRVGEPHMYLTTSFSSSTVSNTYPVANILRTEHTFNNNSGYRGIRIINIKANNTDLQNTVIDNNGTTGVNYSTITYNKTTGAWSSVGAGIQNWSYSGTLSEVDRASFKQYMESSPNNYFTIMLGQGMNSTMYILKAKVTLS